jgi:hypothetical protein
MWFWIPCIKLELWFQVYIGAEQQYGVWDWENRVAKSLCSNRSWRAYCSQRTDALVLLCYHTHWPRILRLVCYALIRPSPAFPSTKVNDDVLPFQGGKCVLGIDNVADTLGLTLRSYLHILSYHLHQSQASDAEFEIWEII